MMGKDQYVRGLWEYFCRERDGVKRFREQAKEYLEQVECCNDTDLHGKNDEVGLYRLEKWRLGKNTKAVSELK